jgi:hypothetical protein
VPADDQRPFGPLRSTARALFTALRPHAVWLVIWLPLALWFAHPLWSARLLPLHDLPNHLARITALHHLGDPRWNLAPYYRRSLQLVPYLGHFYLVHLLAYVVGSVVAGNLVFMVAYVLVTPLCGLSFARATGRSPYLAFLLLPLAVSSYFQWGFISFCAGVMLLLPALAALYRLLDAPSGRRAVVVGLWCAALYLFHIVPWASFGLYAILLIALELTARRVRGPILAAIAMAPSLLMLVIGMRQARSFGYFGGHRYEAVTETPGKLLTRAVGMLNWWQGESLDEWVLIGLMLALLLLIVSDHGEDPGEPWRQRLRVPLAFCLLIGLALATPFWVKQPFNWWMVNQRFLLPAACVALFFPRGPIRGARLGLLATAIAATLWLPATMTRHYRGFSKRAAPLIDLIAATPLGSNTLLLTLPGHSYEDVELAPQMTIWRELYNYPLVYRGGYDPYLYDDGFPIKRIAELPAPKVSRAADIIHSPDETQFHAETMLRAWDYLIVSEEDHDAMPPDGVAEVKRAGRWTLYRSLLRAGAAPGSRGSETK